MQAHLQARAVAPIEQHFKVFIHDGICSESRTFTFRCRLVRRRLQGPPNWCSGSGPLCHRSCSGHSFERLSAISSLLQFPWEHTRTHLGGSVRTESWAVRKQALGQWCIHLEFNLMFWLGLKNDLTILQTPKLPVTKENNICLLPWQLEPSAVTIWPLKLDKFIRYVINSSYDSGCDTSRDTL